MASAQAHAALVARLEGELERAPRRYRLKLALLAAVGYGVLGGALLLALAMSAGLVAVVVFTKSVWLIKLIKVAWIPLVVAWLIFRSLWVRIDPPKGRRVTRQEAPALFDEIERIRRASGGPRLAGVVIDPELNAAAASVPRVFGLFGHSHWLVLGLPLMQALDREQFASVVAHEFGHFGRGHGRFAGWIYRVRVTWYRLLEALEQKGQGRVGWLQGFFNWYAPYFNAYSFALARSNEYEADAVAARVAGKQAAAQALLRVNLAAQRLSQDFWPGIVRANQVLEAPPATLYADMATSLGAASDSDAERLQAILALQPDLEDTHPVPARRIAALGVAPELPAMPRESAADALLGPLTESLREHFAREWSASVEAAWRENHEQARQRRERLQALEADGTDKLEGDTLCDYAYLVEAERGVDEAFSWHRDAAERQPESARAQYQLGRVLLERGEADGIALIRRAIELDVDATAPGLALLAAFHARRGESGALAAVAAEHEQHEANQRKSWAERNRIGKKDVLLPHGLDAAALRGVALVGHRVGGVKRLWVAQKQIPHGGGVPHYLVLVQWKLFARDKDALLQTLANLMQLPGTVTALKAGSARAYERRLRRVAGEALAPR